MIEYVTMGQIEDAIESYYDDHGVVMSFYAALLYLKRKGMTAASEPTPPDFSKWNLNDLPGLLDLFSRIPIPLITEENSIAEENAQRNFYEAATTVFKQPCLMQTLDHPEHEREPSNSVRIIYVLKGSCRITLGKWSDTLESESVVILSSDMNLFLETGRKDIVLNAYIDRSHFNKSFFADMRPDDVLIPFFESGIYEAKNGVIHFKALQPDHIHSIFQRLMIEMCHKDIHTESIMHEYIRLLCIELNRASMIYSDSVMDEWTDAGNRLVQVFPAMLQYIRAHYDTVSLTSLSERFCYDSAYLSKMFKKLTGSNFTSILTQIRLEAAEQLLLDGNKKVDRIAAQVGYDSYDHFARMFKKKYGVTPHEFRRQHVVITR